MTEEAAAALQKQAWKDILTAFKRAERKLKPSPYELFDDVYREVPEALKAHYCECSRRNLITEEVASALQKQARKDILTALERAERKLKPSPYELFDDVYREVSDALKAHYCECSRRNLITEDAASALQKQARKDILTAFERAERKLKPSPYELFDDVYREVPEALKGHYCECSRRNLITKEAASALQKQARKDILTAFERAERKLKPSPYELFDDVYREVPEALKAHYCECSRRNLITEEAASALQKQARKDILTAFERAERKLKPSPYELFDDVYREVPEALKGHYCECSRRNLITKEAASALQKQARKDILTAFERAERKLKPSPYELFDDVYREVPEALKAHYCECSRRNLITEEAASALQKQARKDILSAFERAERKLKPSPYELFDDVYREVSEALKAHYCECSRRNLMTEEAAAALQKQARKDILTAFERAERKLKTSPYELFDDVYREVPQASKAHNCEFSRRNLMAEEAAAALQKQARKDILTAFERAERKLKPSPYELFDDVYREVPQASKAHNCECSRRNLMTEEAAAALQKQARKDILTAFERAERKLKPSPYELFDDVYCEVPQASKAHNCECSRRNLMTEEAAAALQKQARKDILTAFEWAERKLKPSPYELFDDVYREVPEALKAHYCECSRRNLITEEAASALQKQARKDILTAFERAERKLKPSPYELFDDVYREVSEALKAHYCECSRRNLMTEEAAAALQKQARKDILTAFERAERKLKTSPYELFDDVYREVPQASKAHNCECSRRNLMAEEAAAALQKQARKDILTAFERAERKLKPSPYELFDDVYREVPQASKAHNCECSRRNLMTEEAAAALQKQARKDILTAFERAERKLKPSPYELFDDVYREVPQASKAHNCECSRRNLMTEEAAAALQKQARKDILTAFEWAERKLKPSPYELFDDVYREVPQASKAHNCECSRRNLMTEEAAAALQKQARKDILTAFERAERKLKPSPYELFDDVYREVPGALKAHYCECSRRNLITEEAAAALQKQARKDILTAFERAERKLKPSPYELFDDVYREVPESLKAQAAELREHLAQYSDKYPVDNYAK